MRIAPAFPITALASLIALSGCAPAPAPAADNAPSRIVDLGHPLDAKDPTWDGKPVFSRSVVADLDKDGYAAGAISTAEHFGTHVDAPAHFAKGGATVDQLPVERLYLPAVCMNVAAQVAGAEDYLISPADIAEFEAAHGRIPAHSIVLLATGWDGRWPDAGRYMNEKAGVKHFPGLSMEAAAILANDRQVWGIGIDTASIDYGPSATFNAHHTTMPTGIFHIENAAHLTSLPATGFSVIVAPINIKGGSGGPARVFALLPAEPAKR